MPEQRVAYLARGVNIVHWFRFPGRTSAEYFRNYVSARELSQLRQYGFTFVRLPIQPEVVRDPRRENDILFGESLRAAVHAIQQAGMAVVIDLHPHRWRLETREEDRDEFLATWRALAALLRTSDPNLTFMEVLNEPVFQDTPADWHALQAEAVKIIRTTMPEHTIIASGGFWGGIRGLLELQPLFDRNIVYSFHFYQPQFWTTLASFIRDDPARPDRNVDRAAIAQLPWPAGDEADCMRAVQTQHMRTRMLIAANYCRPEWGAARIDELIDQVGDWAARYHVPVIAGEIGITTRIPPQMRAAWLRDVRQALEERRIGWALWGYDDVMGMAREKDALGQVRIREEVLQGLGLQGE